MDDQQLVFLMNRAFVNTINASISRANVYDGHPDQNDRIELKNYIKEYLVNLLNEYQDHNVGDEAHIGNIISFKEGVSDNFEFLLNNGELTLGVSQKIINLYLKWTWCLGQINTPPHFPIDRNLLSHLGINLAWTRLNDTNEYFNIIDAAREILEEDQTLASWELDLWEHLQ
ncbi:MAG: hypothetical protein K9G44_14335 [Melioribacteraceae bacterium]|nr:hypothetical protein [Melioribacteraceae bacterium]